MFQFLYWPMQGSTQRKTSYLKAETIIESYHSRGNDKLINRALKEFGTEELPFKRFLP